MTINTTFVSSPVAVGFADAAQVLEGLAGRSVAAGPVSLSVGEPVTNGLVGTIVAGGELNCGGLLGRSIPVDIVVAPWSAQRSEIGLRPLGRLGPVESWRTRRFLRSAWAVLPVLLDAVAEGRSPDLELLGTAA